MKYLVLKLYFNSKKVKKLMIELIITFIVLFAMLWIFAPSKIITSPVGWNQKNNFSPSNIKVSNYYANSKSNFIVIAMEAFENGTQSIYTRISINSGKEFFDTVKIANANIKDKNKSYKMNPKVAVSGSGEIFVIWQDFDVETFEPKIYYSFSKDFGLSWQNPKEFELSGETQFLPQIVYDSSNNLHIFYHVYESNKFYLYYASSKNYSEFSKPKRLFQLTGSFRGAFFPAIRAVGNNIYLIWQAKQVSQDNLADDLFFIMSSNGGKSWTKERKITSSPANDSSPYLLIYNDRLYCAYLNNEKENWQIYLKYSNDFGSTWSEKDLIYETNLNCYDVSVTPDNSGSLVFFWYNLEDGRNSVFSRKYNISNNDEKTLTDVQNVSENRLDAVTPIPINLKNQILCLWKENSAVKSKYSDIFVPQPTVFSNTHPEGKWSKQNVASINWRKPKDDSGIKGYATIINSDPNFNPTIQNLESNITRTKTTTLVDGVNFFHIRAIDNAGNYSNTVHYPLLVSSSPLQFPIVNSKTHPEGEKSTLANLILEWEQTDRIRLKGFKYNFSKEDPKYPDIFTDEFKFETKNLEEGNYYFSIVPIDKTNTVGRMTTYWFTIGDVKSKPPNFLPENVQDVDVKKVRRIAVSIINEPKYELVYEKGVVESSSQTVELKLLNLDKLKNVEINGYYFNKETNIDSAVPIINSISPKFEFNSLEEGKNNFVAAISYSYTRNGKRIEKWTDLKQGSFDVKLLPVWSPMESIEKRIFMNFRSAGIMAFTLLFLIGILAVFSGFLQKLAFYNKTFFYRFLASIKLIVSNFFY